MLVVSIDLWGTLIKSSPLFVDAKVELTQKYLGTNKNREHILRCFADTKKQWNDIIEHTGIQPQQEDIFKLLYSKVNGGYDDFSFINDYIKEYQHLAVNIIPDIYSDETIHYLEKISMQCVYLNLSSNTMMINSNSLNSILDDLEIDIYFDRLKYSDELKVSKPNKQMYGNSKFHIGDNILTDGLGARLAGSIPFIINSNDKTIKDAYNFIVQNK